MRYYVFVLFLIAGVVACTKAGSPNYFCTALINNEPWKNKYSSYQIKPQYNNESFDIRFGNQYKGHYYNLTFYNVLKSNVKYGVSLSNSNNQIHKSNAKFNSAEEYDVGGDRYDILESDSANNWIQIIKARKDFTRDIEGKFSVTFVKVGAFQNSPFPDTIRIREGYFYIAKVDEE